MADPLGYPDIPDPAAPLDMGNVEGVPTAQLVATQIAKHKEVLQPDTVTPAMTGFSVQLSLVENTLQDVVKRLDKLIKAVEHRRPGGKA
jgi:hypothetical protein